MQFIKKTKSALPNRVDEKLNTGKDSRAVLRAEATTDLHLGFRRPDVTFCLVVGVEALPVVKHKRAPDAFNYRYQFPDHPAVAYYIVWQLHESTKINFSQFPSKKIDRAKQLQLFNRPALC